jgi:Phage integrase family
MVGSAFKAKNAKTRDTKTPEGEKWRALVDRTLEKHATETTKEAQVALNAEKKLPARRVDAYGEEGPPKSVAGIRTVPLSAQLVGALREWKLRSEYSRPNDLIFANRSGGYVGYDNLIKRRWRAPFNWHGLRHFAVSAWIEAGLTPKTVQTFAGHASMQVTMDRYGHLFPSDDHKRAMDHIANGLFV